MSARDLPASPGRSEFRTDIEGLRALAVGAVLLFHAGFTFAGGGYVGVDVFFVISGFLITNLLLKEAEKSGTIGLRSFYARRIRRLLPASVVTLLFTAVITWLFLPINRWSAIAGDLIGSSFYVVNWRLAVRSVDYLGAETTASPVQHFWSLSVEEQFYFIWPFLIIAGIWAARRTGASIRTSAGVALSVAAVSSLAYSIWYTAVSPGAAYFVTPTRIWELSIGAGVAILLPALRRLPRAAGPPLAIAGVGAIAWSVVAYGAQTAFPSYTALLPTVGTAAVIVAGCFNTETSVHRWLSIGPAQFVGKLSYSLYLYHWPVIVALQSVVGEMNPLIGSLGVAISFLPAYLSFRYVETPFRTSQAFVSPPRRGLIYGVGLTVLGAVGGFFLFALIDASEDAASASAPPSSSGDWSAPAPLQTDQLPDSLPEVLIPPLTSVTEDNPSVYELGCHQNQRLDGARICEYGPTDGPTVALVGDSHSAQWVPAFEEIVAVEGWHFVSFSKSACPFGLMMVGLDGGTYDSCLAWNNNVIDRLIVEVRPDLVISTASVTNLPVNPDGSIPDSMEERVEMYRRGLTEAVARLTAEGIPVVLMADTPRPGRDIPECLASEESISECSRSRDEAEIENIHQVVASELGLPFVDMTDHICTPDVCPAVIDGVIVWRDDGHLTATYSAMLAPVLLNALPDVR